MKHILAGTAEQIGGMPSESSKVVMGITAIVPAVTRSQFYTAQRVPEDACSSFFRIHSRHPECPEAP